MAYVPGIDVSHWEPNIDWRAVRQSGVRFAFVKATEGIYFIDKTFAPNWVNMKRVGILRGAYHYLRGDVDALQQADLFLKTVTLEPGDLPPVLDLENINNEHVPNITLINKAEIWLTKVQDATGRVPMIYSAPYFMKDRLSTWLTRLPAWAKKYPLWIANYPYTYREGSLPMSPPAGWQEWLFWQYSDKGQVPGIQGAVDMNWFRGSLEALYAFAQATVPDPNIHEVQEAETLASIAKQYGIALLDLLESNPELIKPGMKLNIPEAVTEEATTEVLPTDPDPSPVEPESVPVSYEMYTVKAGDNLVSIAARFHSTVEKIAAENRIANPDLISVGQVLKIPKS